ncbi:hypothetical protein GEV33_001924 [Tenebrio molitor]|uniref:MADF domain-containing protein n=1 Tax=Tenebrio molitor TaxID=7067 RepID=A0A8J6LJ89_TENMO|nr:hypothetical protein GEV33_001924 [Tenebrio molitor]
MEDGLLATLVEAHSCLYDKQSPDFKNIHKKQNAWTEIATAMVTNAAECQRVRNNMRIRYARERKKGMETHSGMEYDVDHPWALFNSLRFLDKHIQPKNPSTSNTSPVSNWDSEEAYSTDETVDEAPKTPTKRAANENVRSPGPESQEPTRKRRATSNAALEATLANTAEVLAAYLKQQNADDSDKAFADYVHLTLKTFSKTTK